MSFLWFILIGLLVGFFSGAFTKNADIGKFGSIVIGIIGALTSDFLVHSLNLSAKFNVFGHLVTGIIGSLFFIYLMRKISKSF